MRKIACRFCRKELKYTFVDLGMSPLSNAYLGREELDRLEPSYPLYAYVCEHCFLVQLEEIETPKNIFEEYAYFSSYSETWLEHARIYTDMIVERLSLDKTSLVVEIASNDGYLLSNFVIRKIPVIGVEPAGNVARVAQGKGVPTLVRFFGTELALEMTTNGKQADLIIGNNVLAHVPDLNDFVEGLRILLKPEGIITIEVPHVLKLIKENQFDTIYHEHFSYFSLLCLIQVFNAHGLRIFNVEELSTHGGSLRVYICHERSSMKTTRELQAGVANEREEGIDKLDTYLSFSESVKQTKKRFLEFLLNAKKSSKSVVGYGAPAKGNTLLNYCGVGKDLVKYTVDRNPYKQGKFLPGSHLPIYHPDKIAETKPDYVVILPWNLKDEIMAQMSHIRNWGGQFVIPIPEVYVLK
jgi:SAM-dependent methyltransferase